MQLAARRITLIGAYASTLHLGGGTCRVEGAAAHLRSCMHDAGAALSKVWRAWPVVWQGRDIAWALRCGRRVAGHGVDVS